MAGAAEMMGACNDGFPEIVCGGVPRAGIAVAGLGSGTNAAAVPYASVAHRGGVGSTAGCGGELCNGGKHTLAAVSLFALLDGSSAGTEGSLLGTAAALAPAATEADDEGTLLGISAESTDTCWGCVKKE